MKTFSNYKEHYNFCKEKYLNENDFKDQNLCDMAFEDNILNLEQEYYDLIDSLSVKVKSKFDEFLGDPLGPFCLEIEDPFQYDEVSNILNLVKSQIEEKISSCYLTTNRIQIIRNIHTDREKSSSWLWHYDNNSKFHFKLFIYLSDVDENSSPFQCIARKEGDKECSFAAVQTSRKSTATLPAEFPESRVPKSITKSLLKKDWKVRSIHGPKGTYFFFDPNIIHRATVPNKGFSRDALIYHLHPISSPCSEYGNITDQKTTIYEAK